MKALVTGGTGFVGSHLVDHLSRHGVDVHVLMRKTSSDKNLKGSQYKKIEGDISDIDSLISAMQGVDVVYHLAGVITAKNKQEYLKHNATGTENVAKAMLSAGLNGKRLVYVSSLAAGGHSDEVGVRNEDHNDAPVSSYGFSKGLGEEKLKSYFDQLSIVILRPPAVYGPKDPASFIVVKTVSKKIVPLLGPKKYSLIHVSDLTRAIELAGKVESSKIKSGEVFYVSSGEIVDIKDWMSEIAHNLGIKPIWLPLPQKILIVPAYLLSFISLFTGKTPMLNVDKLNEIFPNAWTCEITKAKNILGFSPQIDLKTGMQDAVNWYKKAGWI